MDVELEALRSWAALLDSLEPVDVPDDADEELVSVVDDLDQRLRGLREAVMIAVRRYEAADRYVVDA